MHAMDWMKLGILGVFVLTAIRTSLRGKVRIGFMRQLFDHSTILAPFNSCFYWFSRVPNQPYLDTERIPDLKLLRENWHAIRQEALRLYEDGHIQKARKYNDLAFNSFFKGGWTRFYFKWYGPFFPSARRRCPETVALLERTPSVNAAMLALLPPGCRLGAHRDPYAGSLRYHLGLITPNDDRCKIFVDGEPYSWRDGRDVLFDQTFVHAAENQTDKVRIILFCDVERPLAFFGARWLNAALKLVLGRATVTANVPGERVGILNRLFHYVYHVHLAGKKLKRVNRRLYYATKYTIFLGIFCWIFL